MAQQDEKLKQAQMKGPRAWVFSLLLQKMADDGLRISPALVVITEASGPDEALGLALRMARREQPGTTLLDWACTEVLAPAA